VTRDAPEERAWLRETAGEARLPVLLAILVAVALQAALPRHLAVVRWWVIVAPEVLLLAVTVAGNPLRLSRDTAFLRRSSLLLSAVVIAANSASAVLLVHALVSPGSHPVGDDASSLLIDGGSVYATNVLAFGLAYWELDRGGPFARMHGSRPYPDLLFPQMSMTGVSDPTWEPAFFDYLYVSFTNATAFSPTDTMPLARWTKALMLVQSAVALVVVGLVVARAVNVLR